MDKKTTGGKVTFPNLGRKMPIFRWLWIFSMVFAILGIVVGFYADSTLPKRLGVWYLTPEGEPSSEQIKEYCAQVEKCAQALPTMAALCIFGGVLLCLGHLCIVDNYYTLICSMRIKKNKIDYNDEYTKSLNAGEFIFEKRKCLYSLSAAYGNEFPKEKKKIYIKNAIAVCIGLAGIIIAVIGIVNGVVGIYEGDEIFAQQLKEYFVNGTKGVDGRRLFNKLLADKNKMKDVITDKMWVLMGVGIALWVISQLIVRYVPNKKAMRAWANKVINVNTQSQK